MAEQKIPEQNTDFPTDVKPVFVKLGLLLTVVISLLLYFWLDSRSTDRKKLLEDIPEEIREVLVE